MEELGLSGVDDLDGKLKVLHLPTHLTSMVLLWYLTVK